MTDVKDMMNLIGWGYGLLTLFAIWLAWARPKTRRGKVWALLAVVLVFGFVPGQGAWEAKQKRDKNRRAHALFEEKCKTVAGEKIYRKVENVEGILLLKVRPDRGDSELANVMWPGAAFAIEAPGDSYIKSFLGYEHAAGNLPSNEPAVVTPEKRGYITPDRRPGGLPGYRYLDVVDEKGGKRYRYVLVSKPRPASKIGWVDIVLEKTTAPDPAPRYGVTFEDHVIPEERALGLASSTVRVLDLRTNEVLGEMIRYAMGSTKPSSANPTPWLTAWKCPGHAVGSDAATRKFVDQILIPVKEE